PKASPLPYVENNYTTPAFWQNRLYFCGINDHCKLFNLSNGLLTTSPASQSAATFAFGGAQPVVTASSGTATSAIMWAVERDTTNNISTLHAFDATNLATELYNSNQAAGKRDQGGAPVKFVVPTVSNGKVFLGAQSEIDVYGLLASGPVRLAAPSFSPTPRGYPTPQSVTLTANSGATIYYTLDGSLPTLSSSVYTGAIPINSTTTIQAIAAQSGSFTSPVAVATYTIGNTTPTFVQGNYATPQSAQASVSVTFTTAQSAGDLNVVVVGWNDSTTTVKSVTDTSGNTYTLVGSPTIQSGVASQAIYYAKNIASAAASANSVTVAFNGSAAYPDMRVLEYSGLDTNSPLDVSAGATGNGTSSSSGAVTTTFANDLIVGANLVQTATTGAGAGFTSRMITVPDADIVEDQVVTTTGSYSAIAPIQSGLWLMQVVAFKAASLAAPTPSAPATLAAAAVSGSEIDLSWGAATETGGTISQYLIERCSGAGCSNFAQVATSTTTGFNDTGLAAATSYTYRVRAADTSGSMGPYSNTAAAATVAANAPTAPSNLTLATLGDSEIDLSWGAATATVGSISQYRIESCQGLGCSNFMQIGTSTTTTFNNTGLTPSTS
ncbi:MAG: chitobiase/beta-hexosaminidase C-terminal domain-containing protein, partial [Steroidobacteraceae bacterium]